MVCAPPWHDMLGTGCHESARPARHGRESHPWHDRRGGMESLRVRGSGRATLTGAGPGQLAFHAGRALWDIVFPGKHGNTQAWKYALWSRSIRGEHHALDHDDHTLRDPLRGAPRRRIPPCSTPALQMTSNPEQVDEGGNPKNLDTIPVPPDDLPEPQCQATRHEAAVVTTPLASVRTSR
jgi:hypothetical protein